MSGSPTPLNHLALPNECCTWCGPRPLSSASRTSPRPVYDLRDPSRAVDRPRHSTEPVGRRECPSRPFWSPGRTGTNPVAIHHAGHPRNLHQAGRPTHPRGHTGPGWGHFDAMPWSASTSKADRSQCRPPTPRPCRRATEKLRTSVAVFPSRQIQRSATVGSEHFERRSRTRPYPGSER